MYEAGIEVSDTDFEFAKPPLSKKFLRLVFEKYQLNSITYFGENMFYIARQNSETFTPMYPGARYPQEIELILD